jgi:flagellar motor switch protein FliG
LAEGVELDEDLARRLAENSSPQSAAGPGTMNGSEPAERGPFAFLVHADADVVAKFLSRESPQTVAVVLSFLQRSHAAELLRRLDTALQAQVLKRLARLEAIDPACVDVLAVALEDWIAREQFSPRPPGQRGNAQLNQVPQAAASSQEEWVARLQRDVSHGFALSTPAERPAPSATAAEPETHPRPERPAPLEFRDLLRLNTEELLRTFRAVPRDVLALALAGADEELIRRLTQNVPRREAKQLKKRLRFDGPTRLDDIEAAQGRVAEIATAIVREVTD